MKKNFLRIYTALICLCFPFYSNAQNCPSARPVWVVAHACNSPQCLLDALEDGANGIEIDVATSTDYCKYGAEAFWSVAHDGFVSPEQMEIYNRDPERVINPNTRYVSLEEYLNLPEMDELSILWLDVKGAGKYFAIDVLVQHVHEVLEARYGRDEYGNVDVPYSIIYGAYGLDAMEQRKIHFRPGDDETNPPMVIDWLRDNLWENEGTGLAREGSTMFTYAAGTLDSLEEFFVDEHDFPKEKHLMTNGFGWPYWPVFTRDSELTESLIEAKGLVEQDRYCVRTGTWSMELPHHGLQVICSEDDYKGSYKTECDLLLIECRNEFFPASIVPFLYSHDALKNYVNRFFKENGAYYKYNNGKYRIAGQRDEDPFYGE